jgi:hypothetical protein
MDVVTKDMPNVQTITRYVLEKQSEPLAVPDL